CRPPLDPAPFGMRQQAGARQGKAAQLEKTRSGQWAAQAGDVGTLASIGSLAGGGVGRAGRIIRGG
ncbi:MAG: hypothetical protein ACUVTW_09450, partial [Thermogutta sp.]